MLNLIHNSAPTTSIDTKFLGLTSWIIVLVCQKGIMRLSSTGFSNTHNSVKICNKDAIKNFKTGVCRKKLSKYQTRIALMRLETIQYVSLLSYLP